MIPADGTMAEWTIVGEIVSRCMQMINWTLMDVAMETATSVK